MGVGAIGAAAPCARRFDNVEYPAALDVQPGVPQSQGNGGRQIPRDMSGFRHILCLSTSVVARQKFTLGARAGPHRIAQASLSSPGRPCSKAGPGSRPVLHVIGEAGPRPLVVAASATTTAITTTTATTANNSHITFLSTTEPAQEGSRYQEAPEVPGPQDRQGRPEGLGPLPSQPRTGHAAQAGTFLRERSASEGAFGRFVALELPPAH